MEGVVGLVHGPGQPKEGPLGSLVEHLAGVTREEPAHRNYDRDLRKLTQQQPRHGWKVKGVVDRRVVELEDGWMRRIRHLILVGVGVRRTGNWR